MPSEIRFNPAGSTQMPRQELFEPQVSGQKGYPEQDSSSSYGSPSCLSCVWTAIRNFFACICPCFFGRTQEKAPDLEKPTDVQREPVETLNPDESEKVEVPRASDPEDRAQIEKGVSLREERIAWHWMLGNKGKTLDDSRVYTWNEIRSQIKDKDKELSALLCEEIGVENIEEIEESGKAVIHLLNRLILKSDELSSEEWRWEDYSKKGFPKPSIAPASSENPEVFDWETCQNNAQIAVDWYPTL